MVLACDVEVAMILMDREAACSPTGLGRERRQMGACMFEGSIALLCMLP